MIFHEKNFEEKNLVPRDPLRVPRVPILGPACGIFSKLNGPCPLGSVGHSHTSFSTGEFQAAQRTLGSDVITSFKFWIDKKNFIQIQAMPLDPTPDCRPPAPINQVIIA